MAKPNRIEIEKDLFDKILENYQTMSIIKAIKTEHIGTTSFFDYIDSNPALKERYTRMREFKAEYELNKLEDIEDKLIVKDIDPATARVLSDNVKWRANKFYPKLYGDKQEVDLNFKDVPQISFGAREKDESDTNS